MCILSYAAAVVLGRIEIFPCACRINVFVFLVPPAVHDLGKSRIFVVPFEVSIGCRW